MEGTVSENVITAEDIGNITPYTITLTIITPPEAPSHLPTLSHIVIIFKSTLNGLTATITSSRDIEAERRKDDETLGSRPLNI